jgi:ABC-type glutathione transport system ATPase component
MRAGENLRQLETLLELNRKILPAEIERVEASVEALQFQLAELEAGYRIQEVEQARYAYEQTQFALEEAHKDKIRFDRLFERKIIAEKDKDVADLKYETALKAYERAQKAYELFKEGYRKESIANSNSNPECLPMHGLNNQTAADPSAHSHHLPFIKVDDVSKNFGSLNAVSAVTFEIKVGAINGLVGSDGAGKTTLLRMIATMVGTASGNIFVDGLDVTRQKSKVKEVIGYMPQRFGLYQDLTVAENLDFFMDI